MGKDINEIFMKDLEDMGYNGNTYHAPELIGEHDPSRTMEQRASFEAGGYGEIGYHAPELIGEYDPSRTMEQRASFEAGGYGEIGYHAPELIGEHDPSRTMEQRASFEAGGYGEIGYHAPELIGEYDPSRTMEQRASFEAGGYGEIGYHAPELIGEYDPNRTEIQAVYDEFGVNFTASKKDTYGTNDNDAIEIMRGLSLSTSVNPKEIPRLVAGIPDESLYMVLSQRFRKSANIMDDEGITTDKVNELGERLYTDFNIIKAAMEQDRNLSGKKIDADLYVGGEKTDLNGLLKEYGKYLSGVDRKVVLWDFSGMPVVNSNNEEMEAKELLRELRQKANEKSADQIMGSLNR